MDKEAQEKIELKEEIYEWLRGIGYTATTREVGKLTTRLQTLGYRKLPEGKPRLLSPEEIDKEHNKWCMRRGKENLKISWRQWIAKAQWEADVKHYEEMRG